jgi:hypothetical protein
LVGYPITTNKLKKLPAWIMGPTQFGKGPNPKHVHRCVISQPMNRHISPKNDTRSVHFIRILNHFAPKVGDIGINRPVFLTLKGHMLSRYHTQNVYSNSFKAWLTN